MNIFELLELAAHRAASNAMLKPESQQACAAIAAELRRLNADYIVPDLGFVAKDNGRG